MALTGDKIYKYTISSSCRNNIKGFLKIWLNAEDSKRQMTCVMHVSIQDAYQQILHELSTMDDRFYKVFDARKLKRCSTGKDWREFAVPELMKMLDIIYWTRNYNEIFNNELVNDEYSESDEESTWVDPYKKETNKIRKLYANFIWSAWAYERLWGPRFGRIIISNNITDAAKVLLVFYIKGNVLHLGFPKGKPNQDESINDGSNRETIEETGVNSEDLCIYTGHDGTEIIKKCPYIGPISKRRSRKHYYVMTTTSVEFTAFKPQEHEIQGVEWYPIDRIPCCDDCSIRQKQKFINGRYMDINYHMVTLRDVNNKNPAILNILNFMDKINDNKETSISYFHAHRRCKHDLA